MQVLVCWPLPGALPSAVKVVALDRPVQVLIVSCSALRQFLSGSSARWRLSKGWLGSCILTRHLEDVLIAGHRLGEVHGPLFVALRQDLRLLHGVEVNAIFSITRREKSR